MNALFHKYHPHGAALDLFQCAASEVLIEGPAGTGKTRAVLEKIHLLARRWPGMRALLVRKTRRSMTESVLVTYEDHVKIGDSVHRGGPRRSVRESYAYCNGSLLVLGGMDRTNKVMSSEYDIVAAFEATELTETDWETLLSRLRNGRMPYQQAIADTNPDAPTHWLNRRAARGAMSRLRSRHGDNPAVDPDYLARLDQLTGVRRHRLREGIWAAAEGTVYEDWDPAVHLIDPFPIPGEWRKIRAIDFGYTNPFVCQWWALDGDGRMFLYRELYQTRGLVQDHAKEIVRLSQHERIEATVADHDAEGRATLERHGVPTLAADKNIAAGSQAVTQRLRRAGDGKPRLMMLRDSLIRRDNALIQAACPCSTAEEFESYVWAKDRGEAEYPLKLHDHGMDAMRYAVAHVDRAVPEIQVRIITPGRPRPYASMWR